MNYSRAPRLKTMEAPMKVVAPPGSKPNTGRTVPASPEKGSTKNASDLKARCESILKVLNEAAERCADDEDLLKLVTEFEAKLKEWGNKAGSGANVAKQKPNNNKQEDA